MAAAWLGVGKDDAVVSHESALDLWELTDLIPDAVHLSVPRTRRHLPRLPGVRVHTTTRPFGPDELRWHEGVRVTAPARTLLDVAEAGAPPDQVVRGLRQALERGWLDRERLGLHAAARGRRVARLVDEALADAARVAPGR